MEIASNIMGDVAGEVGAQILLRSMERLRERRGGKERLAVIALVYSFDYLVSKEELLAFLVKKIGEAGVDESGYIGNVARISYDIFTYFDDLSENVIEREVEFEDDAYEEVINYVTKIVIWIDVLKWDRSSLEKVYDTLTRVLKVLRDHYRGRYKILVYIRGRVRKRIRCMEVIHRDENFTVLSLDPLSRCQVEEFLRLPGGWLDFL